jgi:GNAT superfamily N-acetyltransferase
MNEDKYISHIMQGHELYWNMLGNMRGNQNHTGDICWISGDLFYSYATKLKGTDYESHIEQIIGRIKSREIPRNILISPSSAPANVNAFALFMKTGDFKAKRTNLGMLKELNSDTVFSQVDKCLNIFRVNELWQLKICGAILNAAFEYDLFSFEHYLDAFNMQEVNFYIGEYKGLPVGACMSIEGKDIVEIAWVGTLNGYRKKGIAGHIIQAAEKDALYKGKGIAVLSAFEGAINAYKRIGYTGYCKIDVIEYNCKTS